MNEQSGLPNLLLSRLTMTATLAALRGGAVLKRKFGTPLHTTNKEGAHNLVTEADTETEEIMITFIKGLFPDHTFLAEESGLSGEHKDTIRWIIDPLDGTVNYSHGIPMFSTSIAAVFRNEVLTGVIYQPLLNELFVAEKGNGAYLNGERIRVTETEVLDSAISAMGFPYNTHENPLSCLDLFTSFAKMGLPLRRIGSAALDLAYVAAGRFDLFWEVSLCPWDYAAGKLIVEEAGGTFSNFEGTTYETLEPGSIVASNAVLHDQVLSNIRSVMQREGTP